MWSQVSERQTGWDKDTSCFRFTKLTRNSQRNTVKDVEDLENSLPTCPRVDIAKVHERSRGMMLPWKNGGRIVSRTLYKHGFPRLKMIKTNKDDWMNELKMVTLLKKASPITYIQTAPWLPLPWASKHAGLPCRLIDTHSSPTFCLWPQPPQPVDQ